MTNIREMILERKRELERELEQIRAALIELDFLVETGVLPAGDVSGNVSGEKLKWGDLSNRMREILSVYVYGLKTGEMFEVLRDDYKLNVGRRQVSWGLSNDRKRGLVERTKDRRWKLVSAAEDKKSKSRALAV